MALTVEDTSTSGRLTPPDPRAGGPQFGGARKPIFPEAEELFRGIYTRAGLTAPGVIAVTSAIAGEGKTTVALGLAVMVAQDFPERRVLLAEADLRQPVLAADFDVEPSPGLSGSARGHLPGRPGLPRDVPAQPAPAAGRRGGPEPVALAALGAVPGRAGRHAAQPRPGHPGCAGPAGQQRRGPGHRPGGRRHHGHSLRHHAGADREPRARSSSPRSDCAGWC